MRCAATTQTHDTTNHPRNPTPHVGCASCGRPSGGEWHGYTLNPWAIIKRPSHPTTTHHPIFITSCGLNKAMVIPSAAEESETFVPHKRLTPRPKPCGVTANRPPFHERWRRPRPAVRQCCESCPPRWPHSDSSCRTPIRDPREWDYAQTRPSEVTDSPADPKSKQGLHPSPSTDSVLRFHFLVAARKNQSRLQGWSVPANSRSWPKAWPCFPFPCPVHHPSSPTPIGDLPAGMPYSYFPRPPS